jgi:FkbM family methyltransferase
MTLSTRESSVNTFGKTFKTVNWHTYRGVNHVDDPWNDELSIREKYWTNITQGQVVIDVGACFGLYTMSALAQGASVISFEPNKEFLDILSESVSMNSEFDGKYIGHNAVLWNSNEYPKDLDHSVSDWCKKSSPFYTTTLDDITKNFERVDIVKIDVEGAELGVLQGAQETIKKHHPFFLIEDHTGLYDYCTIHNTNATIVAMLKSYGYTITMELFGGPPPPAGGRYFIIATPPKISSSDIEYKTIHTTSRPTISVIIPTNRVGGLDLLFECFKNQSFQDFEIVLMDALFNKRHDIVSEKAKEYGLRVKHIEPKENTFPISNYCKSINTGLCAAEGSVVYFSCDHAYLLKDTLQTHANFHQASPKNCMLMLAVNDCPVDLDKVSNNFPKDRQYGTRGKDREVQLLLVPEADYVNPHNIWSDRYADDLKNGLLDKVLFSIFEIPFTYEDGLDRLIKSTSIDTKFHNCSPNMPTPAFHDLCCLKNDSFKLDFLLDANGMEEEMDGTHGFQDSELARRLLRVHGCQFYAMNTMPVSVINTRYYLVPRKIMKGYNNHNIIMQKNMRETALTNNTITEWKKNKSIG